jgi:hypothetical protein
VDTASLLKNFVVIVSPLRFVSCMEFLLMSRFIFYLEACMKSFLFVNLQSEFLRYNRKYVNILTIVYTEEE